MSHPMSHPMSHNMTYNMSHNMSIIHSNLKEAERKTNLSLI